MISRIQGKLLEKNPAYVVIDCNGVGYFINISLHTYSFLNEDPQLNLYTHLQVKEDALTLFGFAEKMEREIFIQLISVSGIGAGTARTVLSSISPTELRDAIINENVVLIQSVKGIGAKTAQRIILDLKDKILKTGATAEVSVVSNNTQRQEALTALEVLGFSRRQCVRLVDKILSENPNINVENIIKQALNNL